MAVLVLIGVLGGDFWGGWGLGCCGGHACLTYPHPCTIMYSFCIALHITGMSCSCMLLLVLLCCIVVFELCVYIASYIAMSYCLLRTMLHVSLVRRHILHIDMYSLLSIC